jgi:hypothetical protein
MEKGKRRKQMYNFKLYCSLEYGFIRKEGQLSTTWVGRDFS